MATLDDVKAAYDTYINAGEDISGVALWTLLEAIVETGAFKCYGCHQWKVGKFHLTINGKLCIDCAG